MEQKNDDCILDPICLAMLQGLVCVVEKERDSHSQTSPPIGKSLGIRSSSGARIAFESHSLFSLLSFRFFAFLPSILFEGREKVT